MKEKYVVYWEGLGTSTHHYFKTYHEAKKYVVSNELPGARIAKVMAYMKSELVEVDKVEPPRDNDGAQDPNQY